MIFKVLKANNESNIKRFLKNCYISFLNVKDKKRAAGNFDALYNFYRAIYVSKNFDKKIMITRRSYVLFKIIEKALVDETYEKSGDFYTSNFISQISNTTDINSKSILIIDDIVINGRTMEKSYNKLNKLLSANSCGNKVKTRIELHAFLINEGAKCLKNIKDHFIDEEVKVSESCWRSVSDELNLFIAVTNIGYTSYVDTVNIRFKDIDKIIEMLNRDSDYTRQTNALFNKIGLKSYIKELKEVDFQNTPEFYKLLKKLGIIPFLRLYISTNIISDRNSKEKIYLNKNATVIPFAYLPSIKKSGFVFYSKVILSFLKEHTTISDSIYENIESIVSNINNKPDEEYIYLYEWFTFIISKLIETVLKCGCVFLDNAEIEEYDSGISCVETFNETHVDKIKFKNKSLAFDNEYSYKALEKAIIEQSSESDCVCKLNEIKEKLQQSEEKNSLDQNLRKALPEYLSEVRMIDESRAQMREERLKGLRVDDIYYIYNTKLRMESIIKVVINSWDCGDGSGAPRIFKYNNEKIISTSIVNGEQIYRYIFDANPQESYDFHLFYSNSIRRSYSDLKKFAEFMDNEFRVKSYTNFLDYFKVPVGDFAPEDFVAGIDSEYAVDKSNPDLKRNFDKIMRYIGIY